MINHENENHEDDENDSPLYETWYKGTAGDLNLIYEGENEYEARVAAQAEVIRGWIWDTDSWDYHEDGRRTHVEEDGEYYEAGGEYMDVEWDDVVEYVQKTPVILIHPDPDVSYDDVGRLLWDLGYIVCTAVQTVEEARREWPNYVAVEVIRLTANGAQKVPGFDKKTAAAE